jgi:ankyrin repeat protein
MRDVSVNTKALNTTLLEAVAKGSLEEVREALAAGADVNAICKDGDYQNSPSSSALHLAANYRFPLIAQLLIEKGADIEKRTKLGETPLLLASMGATTPEGSATLELLLKHGAKATTADKKKQTPLHFLAFNSENPGLIEMVINAGGKVNAATKAGRTPLHRAASSGRAANVKMLLDHGANLDARDGAGKQPIHNAADYDEVDRETALESVRVLLDAGADPHAIDKDGRTLADVFKQDTQVLQMIAAHDAKVAVSNVLAKVPYGARLM